MGLTKEDLDKIKLPLSDEDYKMLREEDARSGYKIWRLASPELREAFDKKEAERVEKVSNPRRWRWIDMTGRIAGIMDEPEDGDGGNKNDYLNTISDETDMGKLLGEIGCKFRSNIENHIKDYKLQKGDDVEWLLEPLTEISHPADLVLDAYKVSTPWEFIYKLYFHFKNASSIYTPFDKGYKEPCLTRKEGNTIYFLNNDEIEMPKPKPFDKSMIIKDDLNPLGSGAIPSIWDELIVPFTTVGIWQAVLLHQTVTLFPKGWHANYMKSIYVYSLEDMQTIVKKHKRESYGFDHEKLASYLNRDDIMPSVKIDGDKAIAAYYYWNDWSGFCRRIIPIEKHGNTIKFGEFEREKLVEYDCGWNY